MISGCTLAIPLSEEILIFCKAALPIFQKIIILEPPITSQLYQAQQMLYIQDLELI